MGVGWGLKVAWGMKGLHQKRLSGTEKECKKCQEC